MIKFRGHSLVIGMSGAGKGMLTASQARAWQAAGMKVFLLCNKEEEYDEFPANFKTMDQAYFLEMVRNLRAPRKAHVNTLVVIDEAWDWNWKKKDIGLQLIPNMARALGVEMWVQSQFPTQMAPTVRGNCDNVFVFRQREPAAIKWASDCYGSEFAVCKNLDPGRYIGLRGMGQPFYGCSWYVDNSGNFHSA